MSYIVTPWPLPTVGLMKGGGVKAGNPLLQLKAGVTPVSGETNDGLPLNPRAKARFPLLPAIPGVSSISAKPARITRVGFSAYATGYPTSPRQFPSFILWYSI